MGIFPSLPAWPLLVVAVGLAGCSKDDSINGDHPAPTPNKLRGLFRTEVDEPGTTTVIRLEFKDGSLDGKVDCTPKSPKISPVSVEGSTGLQTDALDQATGRFTVAAFSMEKTSGEFYCQGGLRAGTYDFKVEELKLTLTLPNVTEPIIYTKIGDPIE